MFDLVPRGTPGILTIQNLGEPMTTATGGCAPGVSLLITRYGGDIWDKGEYEDYWEGYGGGGIFGGWVR